MLITGFIYTLTCVTMVTAKCYSRSITLNDGNKIPSIGFGTFGQITDIESVGAAVVTALEAGYRLIDTAYIYLNEEVVGEAILNVTRRGIVKRKELFINSKPLGISYYKHSDLYQHSFSDFGVMHNKQTNTKITVFLKSLTILTGRNAVVPFLKKSLAKLKLDYLDLYLIHVPRNQVNPTMAHMGLVAYCQSQNIQVISYAPFGFAVPRPFNNKTLAPSFDDPTLVEIANKYHKSTSQVFLRYLIDRATIPIPKSTNEEHIRSNIDVFDFALTSQEVYKISKFDINTQVYLQKGLYFPDELYTYIFGATLEEVFRGLRSS